MDFFISDTHFGHANIIKFCDRPFESTESMRSEMISRWNAKVTPQDRVFHLGDFGFGRGVEFDYLEYIFNSLNGVKFLIKGNHDHKDVRKLKWTGIYDALTYNDPVSGKSVELFHYPMYDWNKRLHGSLHFYGHVHNNPREGSPRPNAYNVCCEVRDYEPKTVAEIVAAGRMWD